MSLLIGEYRLLHLLGEGPHAQVWAAQRQMVWGSVACAVKIVRTKDVAQPSMAQLVRREARLAVPLRDHRNIISVFDAGEHEGRRYLAMERVEGLTLRELCVRVGRPWSVDSAVAVASGLLRALCHIHGVRQGRAPGLVHCDITPHNVMISRYAEVKLTGFGRAQPAGQAPGLDQGLGTLGYVPREQVDGDSDERVDLYAVGAILFELLDGRRFRWYCADDDALFQEIYRDRIPTLDRTDVPAPVRAVMRGLLHPHRDQRIGSAAHALSCLEAWQRAHAASGALASLCTEVMGSFPIEGRPSPSSVGDDVPQVRVPNPSRASRTAIHPGFPSVVAAQRGAIYRAVTVPHPRAVAKEPATDRIEHSVRNDAPTVDRPNRDLNDGVPRKRHRSETAVMSSWVAVDESDESYNERPAARPVSTTVQSGALEGPVSDGHSMSHRWSASSSSSGRYGRINSESDVPLARNAAQRAVTEPQPSRLAPWSQAVRQAHQNAFEPLAHPEPSAPQPRGRPRSLSLTHNDGVVEPVTPRGRESVSMHQAAASNAWQPRTPKPTASQTPTTESSDLGGGVPVWEIGSYRGLGSPSR